MASETTTTSVVGTLWWGFRAFSALCTFRSERWGRGAAAITGTSHSTHIVEAMATFTREEIEHLADLARIALTDEEITRMQSELNAVADAIDEVQKVATDDVQPTANPVPLEAYLRPDVAVTPLTQEEALAGAPATDQGMFVAPQILGE